MNIATNKRNYWMNAYNEKKSKQKEEKKNSKSIIIFWLGTYNIQYYF